MAIATRTRSKVKTKRKPEPKQKAPAEVLEQAPTTTLKPAPVKVQPLYLITGEGLQILIGNEGDAIREKIKADKDNSPLVYRHYDDDKRQWATWAVLQPDGESIKPVSFPDPSEYGMTPPELFTKAATYKSILSHAVGQVRKEKETLWDKMMKPATVIVAIVAVLMVLGIVVIGAGG